MKPAMFLAFFYLLHGSSLIRTICGHPNNEESLDIEHLVHSLYPFKNFDNEQKSRNEPLSAVVELGIVCDVAFSSQFDNNQEKITKYFQTHIEDMEVDFQTLTLTKVSFSITSVLVIQNRNDQPFIERNWKPALNGTIVSTDFKKWVYNQEIANISDVVLLVTGEYLWNPVDVDVLCKIDDFWKVYHSTVVLEWKLKEYVPNISVLFAQVLGAKWDSETECKGSSMLMDTQSIRSRISNFYFSKCSDAAIFKTLKSSEASCLRQAQLRFFGTKYLNSSDQFSLSIVEQCHITKIKKMNKPSCIETNCRMIGGEMKRFSSINPLYNTPCDEKLICFRGRCLPPGSKLSNRKTKKCFLPSNTKHGENKILLSQCPLRILKFDKLVIKQLPHIGSAFFATDNDIHSTDQCMAVNFTNSQLHLEKNCSSSIYTESFMWDILDVGDGTSDILICHRQLKKCLSSNSNDELIFGEGIDLFDESKRWKVTHPDKKPFVSNKLPVESQYMLNGVVRIALICDAICGKVFNFNKANFQNYLNLVLTDTMSKFETLESLNVSIVLTSIITLWDQGHPRFFKKTDRRSSKALDKINTRFGKWIYLQMGSIPEFDVAVLATTVADNEQRIYAEPSSACKIDSKIGRFHGTVIFQIGRPKTNSCQALSDAIAQAIEAQNPSNFGCEENPYIFSKCKEKNIRQFMLSKPKECLKSFDIDATPSQEASLFSESNISPNFQAQCNFGQKRNLTVKKEDENCFKTPCLTTRKPNLVLQNIFALHNTKCDTNKYCLYGRCTEAGNQLQNVGTEKCLSGSRLFSPFDRVHVSKCTPSSSLRNNFIISLVNNEGGYMLKSLIPVGFNSQTHEKCLTVDHTSQYLQFKPCSDETEEDLIWNLIRADQFTTEFSLHHNQTRKCVSVEEALVLISVPNSTMENVFTLSASDSTYELRDVITLTVECNRRSKASSWKFFDAKHPMSMGYGKQEEEIYDKKASVQGIWINIIITVLVVTILIIVLLIWGIWAYKKRFRTNKTNGNHEEFLNESFYNGAVENLDPDLSITEQTDLLPFDKSLEFPVDRLILGNRIGSGAFGNVFKAKALGIIKTEPVTTVAVKTTLSTEDTSVLNALKSELKILANIAHFNVVNLLGACIKYGNRTGQLYMILEYCKFGNLRTFLLNNRANFVNDVTSFNSNPADEPTSNIDPTCYKGEYDKTTITPIKSADLVSWSFQIARGMEYLALKRILHGDLAARNILLTENNIVKICDFGFSKELTRAYDYNYKKCMENAKVPYKWMAIESIKLGIFSTQSDCWSFAIVLWEIFSLGELPYPGIAVDDQFAKLIEKGYRMDKPLYAPSRLYDIMLRCWSKDPNMRPEFSSLVQQLDRMLEFELREYYLQLESDFHRQSPFSRRSENSLIFGTAANPRTSDCLALAEDSDGHLKAVSPPRKVQRQSVSLNSSAQQEDDEDSAACSLLGNHEGVKFVK